MKKLEQSCLNYGQLRLYIHIPFCLSKCYYCDFYSHVGTDEEQKEYVENLISEIKAEAKLYQDRQITSVFIGGGTPSSLTAKNMNRIMNTIFDNFKVLDQAEISIEMNPKTKSKEKLEAYLNMGINRLSIGMQTTNNEELKSLGRCHTYEDFLDTFQTARNVGFKNINVDIMGAIPGQTMESYRSTLKSVCELEPEHISSYSLILEEGTKFYDWYVLDESSASLKQELPTEDSEREMYEETEKILNHYGYIRYEISNYAKEGMECKHNIGYWTGDDYLGFGDTAASMVNHTRWTNKIEEKHELSVFEQMEEYMFLGLRMMRGISISKFERLFKVTLEEVYGEVISELIENGLLEKVNRDQIALTKRGIDVSNYVFEQFLQNVV